MEVTPAMLAAAWKAVNALRLSYAVAVPEEADNREMRAAIEAALDAAWIRCSERMPELDSDEVLIELTRNGAPNGVSVSIWNGVQWKYHGWCLDPRFVARWMPLPAPRGPS